MKKLLTISIIALTLALVNCSDKSTDEPEPEPTKTLNKSLITDKYWVSSVTSFYFRSDGKYCGPDGVTEVGTWKWMNNSDSLEINKTTTGRFVWYVKYCTETEMSAKPGYNGTYMVFKKQ